MTSHGLPHNSPRHGLQVSKIRVKGGLKVLRDLITSTKLPLSISSKRSTKSTLLEGEGSDLTDEVMIKSRASGTHD